MNKKVLILSASPRRNGNSDLLCDEFLRGTIEGGNTAEKIFIRDKKINYCVACDACVRNKGVCAFKDDMAEILVKMKEADVIVMASPVYFYSIDAQLKTVIDRTVARYTEITDKEFYFILSAADTDIDNMDRSVETLRGFTDCLDGAIERGIVFGVGAWQVGDIKGKPSMLEAYQMGKNI